MGAISGLVAVLVTLFLPPVGVFMVAGCGPDFFINICLTLLGFLPGTVHGFYVLYVYYDRREQVDQGRLVTGRAPGIYSDRVQGGGATTYGTMN